jgi:hypothetical protein
MCHAAAHAKHTHKVEAKMRQQLEEKERELMAEVAKKSKAAADAQVRNVRVLSVDAGWGRRVVVVCDVWWRWRCWWWWWCVCVVCVYVCVRVCVCV